MISGCVSADVIVKYTDATITNPIIVPVECSLEMQIAITSVNPLNVRFQFLDRRGDVGVIIGNATFTNVDNSDIVSLLSSDREIDPDTSIVQNNEGIAKATINFLHEFSIFQVFILFATDSSDVSITRIRNATPSSLCGTMTFTSTPGPEPIPPNHNYCTEPIINIIAQTSIVNSNIITEAVFRVQDDQFHSNGCGIYQCCISPIDHGTQFDVYSPFINCTLINNIDTTMRENTIKYALLKFILGRLIFGNFDIKWLYRCCYNELRCAVAHSQYANFIKFLDMFIGLERFFVWCCDTK